MKPIRYYTPAGQEAWAVRPGQTIPVGSMIQEGAQFRTLTTTQVVRVKSDGGNPYDQGSRPTSHLYLSPISS